MKILPLLLGFGLLAPVLPVEAGTYPLGVQTQEKMFEYCQKQAPLGTQAYDQCWNGIEAKAFQEQKWCNDVDPMNTNCVWNRLRETLY